MENLDSYTANRFNGALREVIASLLANPKVFPEEAPTAYILGGQSGAGKSTLHTILKKKPTWQICKNN